MPTSPWCDFAKHLHDPRCPPYYVSSCILLYQTAMRVAENNDTCVKRAQENGPVHSPASSSSSTKTTTAKKNASSAQAQEDDETASPDEFCCGDKAQVRLPLQQYGPADKKRTF